MAHAWYIDTIDVRSGYAFASLREADILTAARLHSGPSVFIAPPSFHAEPIINVGIAAGAARRGSQEGLFSEQGEVPFKSAEAAAEFVRRAYLVASSNDNGGDEGQELPPDPPEPPPVPEGLAEALQAVRARLSQFERQVDQNQSMDQSSQFDWFGDDECRPQDVSKLASYGFEWVLQLLAPALPHEWAERPDFLGALDDAHVPQAVLVALRCERSLRNYLGLARRPGRWEHILFDPHVHPWISSDSR